MEENKEIPAGPAPESPRPMTLHIIHHNDLDGICAAAIVARENNGVLPIIFYETNYNRPVDVSQINPGDRVAIVDFSYPPEEMEKIEDAINCPGVCSGTIIWIDHHKTAAQYDYSYSGLRDFHDKGPAGCELAWTYFFPDTPMPKAVSLIGDYDSWRLAMPESREFYEGAKIFILSPESTFWPVLLKDDPELLQMIQAAGQIATAYRDQYCLSIRKSYGYETELAGHKAYAMNLFGFGSGQFGDLFKKYPLVIAYVHDGVKFTVSLYSETIDVGAIAQQFGGGGHKGAAGFVCPFLLFKQPMPETDQPIPTSIYNAWLGKENIDAGSEA